MENDHNAVAIDGSFLEGGGQILRISSALSGILKRALTVNSIRANRTPPGLRPQHLNGLSLVGKITRTPVTDLEVGSTTISLAPTHIKSGCYEVCIGTAGSVCLIIQNVLPLLLFADGGNGISTLSLIGGTNADMAPPIDYFIDVLPFYLGLFGVGYELKCSKRGFFPKGGGMAELRVESLNEGCSLSPVTLLDRGSFTKVVIKAWTAGRCGKHVSGKMIEVAKSVLKAAFGSTVPILEETVHYEDSLDSAAGIITYAYTDQGCIFSAVRNTSKRLSDTVAATECAQELCRYTRSKATCDDFMQDQLVIFMTLAKGQSALKVGCQLTAHTKTAMFVAESLTGAKFELIQDNDEEEGITILCTGIGHVK